MKIHKNTTDAVVAALRSIFEDKRYADKVIEKVLKQNPRWGARDRRYIAETTYDVVRWYRLLKEISGAEEGDYWTLTGACLALKDIALPPWEEFARVDRAQIARNKESAAHNRAVRESIPDWLDEKGQAGLGERWEKELRALNEEAQVVLRVNTLKTTREALQQQLKDAGVATSVTEKFPDALIVGERQNVFRLPLFADGLFEVQDAASQAIAPFLEVAPGQRVIDACAGAGGKTLHLAALMQNKGRLIALDVEPVKLDELLRRARRAGVTNLETRPISSSKVIKRLADTADRLLLDVPCSGSGVLKRNPDAKWKLTPAFIDQVIRLQQQILNDYCRMVKPGGLMVYATCSILPAENEEQVAAFVRDQPSFELINEQHLWPSAGFDGFYMALFSRKDA